MSWLKGKIKQKNRYVMFDIEKVMQSETLTPIQTLELICSAFQIAPKSAVLMGADPDNYEKQYPNISHLLKVKEV